MLNNIEIADVYFHQGRVLITCTIEIHDEMLGSLNLFGYGSTKEEALDDANAALWDVLEHPDSLYDPDEPMDTDNDLLHLTA